MYFHKPQPISSDAANLNAPLPEKVKVLVPTATAVIFDKANPYMVLVGTSAKHEAPVLPGGKLEVSDIVGTDLRQCASRCLERELMEEIGANVSGLDFLALLTDDARDVRVVRASSLSGTLADPGAACGPDDFVIASYGVPDFVFMAGLERREASESAELSGLQWVDCRMPPRLGAGHSAILEIYVSHLAARNEKAPS